MKESLIGKRFGLLVVTDIAERQNGLKSYICQCDCGKMTKVLSKNLTRSNYPTKSCGCLKGRYERKKKIFKPSDQIPWPATLGL